MADNAEIYEKHLVEAMKEGSERAFFDIYGLYAGRLLGYVSSVTVNQEDAEDIVQEIFMDLWDRRRYISTEYSLSGFLFSIAYRKRIDYFRKSMRLPVYEDFVNCHAVSDHDTKGRLEYREFLGLLNEALEHMPEKKRRVFVLSRFKGLSYKEIARKTGISEGTAKNVVSECLKIVRETLDKNGWKLH